MPKAIIPINEQERLKNLYQYRILDTAPDRNFDEIVELASEICGTPISLITLLDDHRQWFKAKKGIEVDSSPRDIAFCAYSILSPNELLEVNDTLTDSRFSDNPLVTEQPEIRFYAGMPLVTLEGYALGTLCVIDTKPKKLTDFQRRCLTILGGQVVKQMELHLKIHEIEEANETINEQNEKLTRANTSKDKLISIVAHDLKTPINNLISTVAMFEDQDLELNEIKSIMSDLQLNLKSATQLINDLTTWTSRQLNHDSVYIEAVKPYAILQQAATHISWIDKKNQFVANIPEDLIIQSDAEILSFLFRNLLSNAHKFTLEGIIQVNYTDLGNLSKFEVVDNGLGIDSEAQSRLFNWSKLMSTIGTKGEKGTGLGLPICNDLVTKLHGKMTLHSEIGKGTAIGFVLPK